MDFDEETMDLANTRSLKAILNAIANVVLTRRVSHSKKSMTSATA